MTTKEQLDKRMAAQVDIVVKKAREDFSDSLEEYLRDKKKAELAPSDKDDIEGIFTDSVRSFLIAEVAAFVSWLVYSELNDDNIVKRIVPSLLDACEDRMETIPQKLAEKTKGLTDTGKLKDSMGGTKEKKGEIVPSLYKDLAQMGKKTKHLRASFDAILLSLSGE